MEPAKQDAAAMLQGASGVESAVRARAPREHPLYFATGAVYALAGVVLDLGDSDGGGPAVAVTTAGVALITVMVITHVPYWLRHRQVRTRSTPTWLEWLLAGWGAAALFVLGILLTDTIDLAFTLGGLVGAVPSLLWAERLRRNR